MSESQTPGLVTILEEWQLVPSLPPMWRCIWKSENGTVIHTWEIESEPFSLLPMSSPCDTAGQTETPVEVSDAIEKYLGGAT